MVDATSIRAHQHGANGKGGLRTANSNTSVPSPRYEKHADSYLTLVQLAAAKIWMRFISR